MTKRLGSLVGTPKYGSFPPKVVSNALENGHDSLIVRDTILLAAAPIADTISLAVVPWDTVLDPKACFLDFDNLGAGTTVSVGDATYPAALAAATATSAAGSMNPLKSVPISGFFMELWRTLGYASLAAAKAVAPQCELLATIAGGAATGNVTWSLKGAKR